VGSITETFEDGIKTITEIKTNGKGQKVKVVKKIRVYTRTVQHNKNVEARKKWKKFGECANAGPGLEDGITSVSTDEIFLNLGAKDQEEVQDKPTVSAAAVCRTCGKVGEHWTTKCPLRSIGVSADAEENKPTEKSDVYIPPWQRAGRTPTTGDAGSGPTRRGDDLPTVRVSNLSEETREQDLSDLFRPFGAVSRIFLVKDKETMMSRGFAFVSFLRHEDAARAIAKLDGYGYDHLILHLEWAKPSK
jgi:translation initiation factor 3 subunit G